MAQNTVTTNGNGGKERDVLVTTKEVHCPSLPWSLRHGSPREALEDARSIALFLRAVNTLEEDDKDGGFKIFAESEGILAGRTLLFHLLVDKLDIGTGRYKFPELAWGEDVPALVARENDNDD